MADRDELTALRRMAELEAKATTTPAAGDPTDKRGRWLENVLPRRDMSPQSRAAIADMQARPWGSGIPQLGYKAGEKVGDLATSMGASPELSAGLGYGTNVATQALPALMSGYKFAGEAPAALLEKPARALMQSAIKPAQADRLSGSADKAIGTMLAEGINPTRGGMDKAAQIASKLDAEVKAAIAASPETVSKWDVGKRLSDVMTKARAQVNPEQDMNAVKEAWTAFRTHPDLAGKTNMPVQLAQQLKSGTYQTLGAKSYGEVGTASTEAQKALARGLRETIAEKVPAVVEPLKREASLMNVRDVAMNRALAQANNNPMGLAALRIGDNPLSSIGFMADKSALLKSMLARMLYSGSNPQLLLPGAIAGSEASNQPRDK